MTYHAYIYLLLTLFLVFVIYFLARWNLNFKSNKKHEKYDSNQSGYINAQMKAELLGSIIHELGNCAAIIVPTIDKIKKTLSKNANIDDEMKLDLQLTTHQLNRIIAAKQDASMFNQLSESSSEFTNINEAISTCWRSLRYDKKADGIESNIVLSNEIPMLNISCPAFMSIIINLIDNSLDALDGATGVRKVNVETYPGDNQVYIKVSDTGCGIKSEYLEKVTLPNFTTKEKGKGTGLGLSIVEKMLHEYDGNISIESQENIGTNVTVSLPVVSLTGER